MTYDAAVHPACDHLNGVMSLCKQCMKTQSLRCQLLCLHMPLTGIVCVDFEAQCGFRSTCRTSTIIACAVPQSGLQAERDFNDLVESVEAMQLGTGINDGGQISS